MGFGVLSDVLISDIIGPYMVIIALESVLSLVLFVLLGAAAYRRRSIPYVLLWVASWTLVARSFVGILPLMTELNPSIHIAIDHSLDIVMIVAALGAVHYARSIE